MDSANILKDTKEKIKLMQTKVELEEKLANLKISQDGIKIKKVIKDLKTELDNALIKESTTEITAETVRNNLLELRSNYKLIEAKLDEMRNEIQEKTEKYIQESYEHVGATNNYLIHKEKIKLEKEKLTKLQLTLSAEQATLDALIFYNKHLKNYHNLKEIIEPDN